MAAIMRLKLPYRFINSSTRVYMQANCQLTCKSSKRICSPHKFVNIALHGHRAITRNLSSAVSQTMLKRREFQDEMSTQQKINQYQEQLFRYSRIDKLQIFHLMNRLSNEEKLGLNTAIFLLRCTGSCLVKQTPTERQAIFHRVLQFIQPRLEMASIAFYNMVLSIRLENEDYFDPLKELGEIETLQGITANRVTYQLMILAYCLRGDVDGAKQILEHMKSHDMAITEHVFHSLIVGYMKQGNIPEAKDILVLMRESGIIPMESTYSLLLNGVAALGNSEEINKVEEEAVEDGIILQPRHLFPVLTTLAKHSHYDLFSKMLKGVVENSDKPPYNIVAMNCVFQLGALGEDERAREVFDSIAATTDSDSVSPFKLSYSRIYVQSLHIQNKPYKMIQDTCESLMKEGFLERQFVNGLLSRINERNNQTSSVETESGIKNLDQLGFHGINALTKRVNEAQGVDGLLDLIHKSYYYSMPNTCGHIHEGCSQLFSILGLDRDGVIKKMQEKEFASRLILHYKIRDEVSKGMFQMAGDLCDELESFERVGFATSTMTGGVVKSGYDVESLLTLIGKLKPHVNPGLFPDVLIWILGQKECTEETSVKLLKSYLEQGVTYLTPDKITRVKATLENKGVSADTVENLCLEMESAKSSFSMDREQRLNLREKGKLRKMLRSDPEAYPLRLRNQADYYDLLDCIDEKSLEKAESLKKKLEENGYKIHPGAIQKYMALCIEGDKDVILEEDVLIPDQQLSLIYARALVQSEKYDDALATLKRSVFLPERCPTSPEIRNLLDIIPEEDTKLLSSALTVLTDGQYIEINSELYWEYRLKIVLKSGNVEEMLSICDELFDHAATIPIPDKILEYFIEKDDLTNMQKVVDRMSSISGEGYVLQEIAVAFISSGKAKQAHKILQMPAVNYQKEILDKVCSRLCQQEKLGVLEQYVAMTKGNMRPAERDNIIFWILKYHCQKQSSNIDKALDVLTIYDEEGIHPSGRTLRYLAKVMKSSGREVPFLIPQASKREGVS